jgi:hypothetical protein
MTELAIPENPPIGLAKTISDVEEAGLLHLKGYRMSEIADQVGVSPHTAKQYVQEYLILVQSQIDADPHFLEKMQFNTLKILKELDEISKESWETVEIATQNGMVGSRVQALKLLSDLTTKKAQLHQLLGGGQKTDAEHYARTQKAEAVNQILSDVIKDIISECEHCRERARVMLAQAFSMMGDDPTEYEAEEAQIVS